MKSSQTSLVQRRRNVVPAAKTRDKIFKNVTFERCLSSVMVGLRIIPKARHGMLSGP